MLHKFFLRCEWVKAIRKVFDAVTQTNYEPSNGSYSDVAAGRIYRLGVLNIVSRELLEAVDGQDALLKFVDIRFPFEGVFNDEEPLSPFMKGKSLNMIDIYQNS